MKTKICRKCLKEKSLNEFYVHKEMKDGYLNICKECKKTYTLKYRKENIEKVREYDRNRPNKEKRYKINKNYRKENIEKIKAHKKAWRNKNRIKINAELKTKRAIMAEKITKPKKCENCGNETFLEAHHTDYSKPLEVKFLCSKCHKEEHKRINKIKRQEKK